MLVVIIIGIDVGVAVVIGVIVMRLVRLLPSFHTHFDGFHSS